MPTATKKSIGSYRGTPIYEGSQEEINAQVNAVQQPAVSSAALAPTTALKLKQPPPSTAGIGFQGMLETQQGAFANTLSKQTKQREASTSSSFDALLQSITQSQGQAQLRSDADKTLAPLEGELQDINNQILQEQEGLRRRLEALDKNTMGMELSALEGEKRRIERDSLAKQADLSIIQLTKQGKYDSAKAIADRAIEARLEQQKQQTDILRFIYEENKDLFTTSEQREFDFAQGERERLLQNEEYRLRAEYDQKIRQNDPLYQAQVANIYSEIQTRRLQATGETLETLQKQEQKIQGRVQNAETVLNKVAQATSKISGALGGFGRTGFVGGLASKVPGTNAYDLRRTLDTIKANLGFEELQAMRDASPTGGALGQVAVQELTMLQATIAALDTGLDATTLRNNLNEVREHYTNWLNTVGYAVAPDGAVVQITD